MTRSLATCRHEAGHAVISALLGRSLKVATIHAGGGGSVSYYSGDDPTARMVSAMAGSLAERGDLTRMSDADNRNVTAALQKLRGDRFAERRRAEATARAMVHRYAKAIEAVAAALHRRGTLHAGDVLAIVDPYRPALAPPKPKTPTLASANLYGSPGAF